MFFFKLVDSKVHLFTKQQEFLTLSHLRSFRQFPNLSEETWRRAVENFIELCFVSFQKKEMFHTRLNNLPVFRNYRDVDFALRYTDVLETNAQISMN